MLFCHWPLLIKLTWISQSITINFQQFNSYPHICGLFQSMHCFADKDRYENTSCTWMQFLSSSIWFTFQYHLIVVLLFYFVLRVFILFYPSTPRRSSVLSWALPTQSPPVHCTLVAKCIKPRCHPVMWSSINWTFDQRTTTSGAKV